MSRSLALLAGSALVLPLALAPVAPAAAADGGRRLTTVLTGAAERPVLGDPDGRGTATVRVNVGQRQVCYALTVTGIERAAAAHIHEAPAGQAGPIVVHLTAPASGSSSGCATVTRELAKEILQSPEDYYVNVHNAPFPGGALRGQLSR